VLPAVQSSVNFVYRKGFRIKIAEPLTRFLVIRVIGVLQSCEELIETSRTAAVFGWAGSFSRHANLVKRFISKQNFFQKNLVLPPVPEIVLVQ